MSLKRVLKISGRPFIWYIYRKMKCMACEIRLRLDINADLQKKWKWFFQLLYVSLTSKRDFLYLRGCCRHAGFRFRSESFCGTEHMLPIMPHKWLPDRLSTDTLICPFSELAVIYHLFVHPNLAVVAVSYELIMFAAHQIKLNKFLQRQCPSVSLRHHICCTLLVKRLHEPDVNPNLELRCALQVLLFMSYQGHGRATKQLRRNTIGCLMMWAARRSVSRTMCNFGVCLEW